MTAHKSTGESHKGMEGLESPRGAASSRSTGGGGGAGQGGDGPLVGGGNDAPKASALAEEVASLVLASLQPQLNSLQTRFDALEAHVQDVYKETLIQKAERLNEAPRYFNVSTLRDEESVGEQKRLAPVYNKQCRLPAEHNALVAEQSPHKLYVPALIPPYTLDLSLISTHYKLLEEGAGYRTFINADGEEDQEDFDTLDPARFDPLLLFYGVKLEGYLAPGAQGDTSRKRWRLAHILGL